MRISFIEKEPLGRALKNKLPEILIELIGECVPIFGGVVKTIASNVYEVLRQNGGK